MKIANQLNTTLAQNLNLTPQLIQSLKILEMSKLELAQFIEEELVQNPFLERQEMSEQSEDIDPPSADDLQNADYDDDFIAVEMQNGLSPYDREFCQLPAFKELQNKSTYSRVTNHRNGMPIEETIAAKVTLSEIISEQIIFTFHDPLERAIAYQLSGSLNEAGYLGESLESLAFRLHIDEPTISAILRKLQKFDPPGIFARNLTECLELQLKRRGEFDWRMELLLKNLTSLAKKNFPHLTRACHCNKATVIAMWKKIRNLNPKPAEFVCHTDEMTVNPDLIVYPLKTGGFHIEMSSSGLPAIFLNNVYKAEICKNYEEKLFFTGCLQKAHWLLKAIDQRAKTLLTVTSAIVKLQEPFFVLGPTYLRPLTLKMVGDAISMHESTVSRVIKNKYIASSFGNISMRQLFSAALPSANGEFDYSTQVVRHWIKQLVAKETADSVLSDDDLVKLLAKQNINVARRTVAKYREKLRIPSSVVRRRIKRMSECNFW